MSKAGKKVVNSAKSNPARAKVEDKSSKKAEPESTRANTRKQKDETDKKSKNNEKNKELERKSSKEIFLIGHKWYFYGKSFTTLDLRFIWFLKPVLEIFKKQSNNTPIQSESVIMDLGEKNNDSTEQEQLDEPPDR